MFHVTGSRPRYKGRHKSCVWKLSRRSMPSRVQPPRSARGGSRFRGGRPPHESSPRASLLAGVTQLDFVRCRCIIYKDDYPPRHRDAAAWPACPLEPGLRPPRWRNGRYRPYRPYCDKDANRPCRCDRHFCNFIAEGQVGRYVPMCPTAHGSVGTLANGVAMWLRRPVGMPCVPQYGGSHRTWFGSHLPRHPEDRSAAQLRQFWLDECGDRLPIADI